MNYFDCKVGGYDCNCPKCPKNRFEDLESYKKHLKRKEKMSSMGVEQKKEYIKNVEEKKNLQMEIQKLKTTLGEDVPTDTREVLI